MRPSKTRIVGQLPKCQKFNAVENEEDAKPSTSECVTIGLDLLEAMRLVDAEGQSQEEAAQRMQVSTPTLCRMLGEGRKLAAEALSLGKTILLQGGNIMYQHHHQHGHGPMHGAAHGAKS
ncbi:MAG: DUF134 domain-containing protein [Desulfovibrio sp.]|nr:DUF134 domain-containing protein [Desulfovibrio sp.]